MKKKLVILILLLLTAGGGTWLVRKQAQEIEVGQASRAAQTEEAEAAANDAENDAAAALPPGVSRMYIDDLDITQGEGGYLLWTLVARRAHMQGEGRIQAEDPFLTYYLTERGKKSGQNQAGAASAKGQKSEASGFPDGAALETGPAVVPENASVLTVKSLAGAIDRQADLMRFQDRVVMVNGDNTLHSELLEYSGREKQLTSPGLARFSSPTMNGSAGNAVLHLTDNILYAAGGVTVNWALASSKIEAPFK